MRAGYLLLGFLCVAGGAYGQAFSICPNTIRVEPQKLATPVMGWSVVAKAPGQHALKAIMFYDGEPKGGASLVPDRGTKLQQTWDLLAQDRVYWMTCQYTGTTVVLARALPTAVRECTLTFAPNLSVEGSPVVQKLNCK
jgi:hypothetical protein